MQKNTPAQEAKLARLVKLGVLEPDVNLIQEVRLAIVFAKENGVLEQWTDYGNFYTLTFRNRKPLRVRATEVGEAIIDRLLEVLDPTGTSEPEEVKPEKPKREAKPKEETKAKAEPRAKGGGAKAKEEPAGEPVTEPEAKPVEPKDVNE